jgi:hypothetical protein
MVTIEEQQFRAQIKSLLRDLLYEIKTLNNKLDFLIERDEI